MGCHNTSYMPMVSSLQRMTSDVLRVGNGFMFYCFYWTMVIHFPHYFSCPFKIFVLVQSPDTLSMMSNMRVCMGYRHSGMHARFASVRQHEPYAWTNVPFAVCHMMVMGSVSSQDRELQTPPMDNPSKSLLPPPPKKKEETTTKKQATPKTFQVFILYTLHSYLVHISK